VELVDYDAAVFGDQVRVYNVDVFRMRCYGRGKTLDESREEGFGVCHCCEGTLVHKVECGSSRGLRVPLAGFGVVLGV